MMRDTVDAALARVRVEAPDEIELPPNATPLDFQLAVMRDPRQPMPRRMQAAIAAAPYVHPKLSVAANFSVGMGSRMERAIAARGLSPVIGTLLQPAEADPGE